MNCFGQSIGDLLKKLRLEKEITLDELAKQLNQKYNVSINKGMISKWEGNKTEPTLKYARIFSEYYNVTLDYLLGVSSFRDNNPVSREIDTIKDYKLLESYNKLNYIGKKEAEKRVEELTFIDRYTDNNDLMPYAAHAKDGATEEDIKHDDDLMNDDSLWND